MADDGSLVGVPTYTREGQEGRQGKFGLVRPINFAVQVLENLPTIGVSGCGSGGGNQGGNNQGGPQSGNNSRNATSRSF